MTAIAWDWDESAIAEDQAAAADMSLLRVFEVGMRRPAPKLLPPVISSVLSPRPINEWIMPPVTLTVALPLAVIGRITVPPLTLNLPVKRAPRRLAARTTIGTPLRLLSVGAVPERASAKVPP